MSAELRRKSLSKPEKGCLKVKYGGSTAAINTCLVAIPPKTPVMCSRPNRVPAFQTLRKPAAHGGTHQRKRIERIRGDGEIHTMEPAIQLKPGNSFYGEGGGLLTFSKSDIRKEVWDYIEKNDLADFPRPVHNRIIYFKVYQHECQVSQNCKVLECVSTVKIDPDSPHNNARFLTLDAHKILLVPKPRPRKGLFYRIIPPNRAGKEMLKMCSTPQGVYNYGVPVSLDDRISVDLVVLNGERIAVNEGRAPLSVQGEHRCWRIGKGEGFADLEHAMMMAMEAVTEDTVVVTIVHDCQVLDFPEDLLGEHNLTVDYILTPTRIIKTDCKRPKPEGIIWSKITWEMMKKIPILKKLHAIEKEAGKNVFIKKDHNHKLHTRLEACDLGDVHTLYIGNIPPTTTINEFKDILQEKGTPPLRLWWQIDHQRAFLITWMWPRPRQNKLHANEKEAVKNVFVKKHHDQELNNRLKACDLGDVPTLYIGNIPPTTTINEFKDILQDKGAPPLRLKWLRDRRIAFLDYMDMAQTRQALSSLQGLTIHGNSLWVDMARAKQNKVSNSKTQ
ncbi:methenyltetrahydrofolate synthase domain-containing isoform X1 [Pelobates cultripes]|uniref:Methenyltetrahydrofolate synthase domain-containing protein n=1 Tax=Pelobates cultripes TaxID=61616 RepID=A0AAD1WUE7_PELCU|nr:methenyltetrahydrofolate synthase domain-containing isoform X1 [Pelobates cultripes]